MSSEQIKFLINLFVKTCNDFKHKIEFDKIQNREYFIRQKININYLLVGELFNFVTFIDSSQFVSRLYTDGKDNIGIALEPFKKINEKLLSRLLIIQNNKILHEEIFIY
jgi:hypothetical protein